MRILIVDDSPPVRQVLETLFKKLGHEVIASLESGDGIEDIILKEQPHVLCLDYLLPGRNGLEILASVNQMAPEVDVVFMTASDDITLKEQAADGGASGFLKKPFNRLQILEELNEIAQARNLTHEPATDSTSTTTSQGSTGQTAIIADDSGSVRLILKSILQDAGLRVLQSVGNGAEAVQAAKTHQPSLICLDVNMPGMSGIQALPQIREASPQSVVVMITGCTEKEIFTQAIELGAKGYILKPLRPAYVHDFLKKQGFAVTTHQRTKPG
jgi:CheY-like chemotaxis protein